MYRPWILEQTFVERELELRRRVEQARRHGQPAPERRRRRSWWPRPRRAALRLAFAGHGARPRTPHV